MSRPRPSSWGRMFVVWACLSGSLMGAAYGATCTATAAAPQPRNWGTASTWSCGVPVNNDDVVIPSGATVILNVNSSRLNDLTINAGGTLRGDNTGKVLTLNNSTSVDLTNNGVLDFGAGNLATVLLRQSATWTGNGTWNLSVIDFSGNTLDFSPAGASFTINLSGVAAPLINAGRLTSVAGITWSFTGTVAQTLPTSTNVVYGNVTIANTAGVTLGTLLSATNLLGNLSLAPNGILNNGGFAITLAPGRSLAVQANARLNLTGTSGMVVVSGGGTRTFAATSTVTYGGANQAVTAETYGNLTLSGSGTKIPAAGTHTFAGSFTLASGVTYAGNISNPTVNLAGGFSNSGTFTAGSGVYTLNGGVAQTLGGSAATTFTNLTVNKPANNLSIACGTPSPTVNGTLTLTSGKIVTAGTSPGCSTACASQLPVIVGSAGTIAGGSNSSYVQGALRKLFAAAATLNFRGAGQDEFPIGDAASYTPVEIAAGGTSTAGNVTVCVTAAEHPQVTTPPVSTGLIDATRSLNRHWSLGTTAINTASGVGAAAVDATFKFMAGDVDAGANAASFVVEEWDGGKWGPTTLVSPGAFSTRAQSIDLSAAVNDIAIGQPLLGVTAAPGNFNAFETATPAGAVLGMIQTKRSGVALSVRLVRLNAAKNALDTTYGQAGVTVELLDSSDNTGAPLSTTTACRPIGTGPGRWQVIAGTTQAVTFAAGVVASVNFTVPNAYRNVRVHVVKTGTGAGEGCSTDLFAIRPQSLTASAFDGTWQTAGTSRALANTSASGGTVHKASTPAAATPRPFTLRATPVPPSATSYDGNPGVVSGFPSCAGLGALCATAGTLAFTSGTWTGGGARENATAHYSEAGAFTLQLEDAGYAAVDAIDGTPLATRTVPATASVAVGRFVPDHFIVAPNNTPQLQTFGSACASRSFTYIGQPFGYVTAPLALVTARNAGGGTLANYAGALWKITSAAPTDVTLTYANGGIGPALDTSAAANPPAVNPLGNGTGTITVSSADRLSYTRSTTTPQAQFNAGITLTVSVRDDSEADGQILTATATPFAAIAFDAGNMFRFGRLRLANSNGSQLIALPVPTEAQYWNGTSFVGNALDNCTLIAAGNVSLANYQPNLASGDTAVTSAGAMAQGRGMLRLSPPGPSKRGGVDVTTNLTGANMTYLQGAWGGVSYTSDPKARATFGLFRNTDQMIYQRENF